MFGFVRRDRKLLERSIELMERACLLIGQNTDPEISELSINHSIARAYSAMGEDEKAVELYKSSNPRGVYNDFIGYILGSALSRRSEAEPYLSRALLRCVSSLTRVVLGYFSVYFKQGDFSAAAEIARLGLDFFAHLKRPGQNSFLDKVSTEIYACLAAAQAGLGDTDGARESLRMAKTLAERFDRAPDYDVTSVRFVSAGMSGSAFDDMGATAMECLLNQLATCKSETLASLWRELTAEGQGSGENNGHG